MARKKARSAAQKSATKKMLAGLRRSRAGKKPLTRSKSNPKKRRKNAVKQVSKFFGIGRDLFQRAKRAPMVETAFTQPMQHALAGAGYAGFEALTVPLAVKLKNGLLFGWKIPIPASQVFGAWLLAQTPWRATQAVGREGIGIETYSVVSQTQLAKTIQQRAATMLNRVLPTAQVQA